MIEHINLWVSSGSHSAPYYHFYTDEQGNNEIYELILNTNNTYTFSRANFVTSHPFYISDSGYNQESTDAISLTGDGNSKSGITGEQSITVSFSNSKSITNLLFYCTSHSNMNSSFELSSIVAPVVELSSNISRLYNNSLGTYLFSSNQVEIDLLTGSGWTNEGVAYGIPAEETAEVFRFYISSQNRHFYTSSTYERDIILQNQDIVNAGWEYEGKAFNAYSIDDAPSDSLPVYRYFNGDNISHLYSASPYEQSVLNASNDWINEGIAWYGESI